VAALYNDNFRTVSRAALSGSSAQAYFKVQGFPGYPVIISRFDYSSSEKVQVVEAFKEYIHLYAFGRAASQVQIQGHCLNIGDDFSGSVPTLRQVYQDQLRAFKAAQGGGLISIVGPIGVLKGVATSLSFGIAAGQDGGSSQSSSAASNTPPAGSSSAKTSAENGASNNSAGNANSTKADTSQGSTGVYKSIYYGGAGPGAKVGPSVYSVDSKGNMSAWHE
jgi:hypothetical protein